MTSPHLHLVREIAPDPKPEYHMTKVWCPGCEAPVTVIHLDLPPEDPKPVRHRRGEAKCPICGKGGFAGPRGVEVHMARKHKGERVQ